MYRRVRGAAGSSVTKTDGQKTPEGDSCPNSPRAGLMEEPCSSVVFATGPHASNGSSLSGEQKSSCISAVHRKTIKTLDKQPNHQTSAR